MTATYPPPSDPPVSVDGPPPDAPGGSSVAVRPVRFAVLGGLWTGAFVGSLLTRGIPLEREQVLAWTIAAMLVVAVSVPGRKVGRVLLDWLPFVAVLVVYDYSRGLADGVGMPIHTMPQLRLEEFLFFGEVPTVWLQQRLLDPARVHRWEVVPAVLYVSHFLVPFVLAGYLWVTDRPRWARYLRRFVVLSFLGVATFVLFPATPPWLASYEGAIDVEVVRATSRGWSVIGLDVAGRLLSKGQAAVNLTAAIPSLHAAYAALVAVTLWPTLRRFGRVVVALYAVGMGWALVLLGEHYVVDVLIGWGYVALAIWCTARLERWWQARADRHLEPAAVSS